MTTSTVTRVQIPLRISPDISRNLDEQLQGSPLSRNAWIEEAIAEKLLSEQTKQSRLDEIEARLVVLESRPVYQPRGKVLTYQGKTQSISSWSIELGIPERTLRDRLERGLSVEQALTGGE